MKQIATGVQDFEKLRMADAFYIDKTKFIREWWDRKDDVTLLTRPRRFGKTLMMDTVRKFFSVEYAGRSELFQELEIWKDESYRQLQGKYPVIFLSFADVKEVSYPEVRKKICENIVDLYNQYDFLPEEALLNEREKKYFHQVSAEMGDAEISMSLQRLSGYLFKYYGKKAVILLDEYDTPMQEAYVGGYWEELSAFMRSLRNATFKE